MSCHSGKTQTRWLHCLFHSTFTGLQILLPPHLMRAFPVPVILICEKLYYSRLFWKVGVFCGLSMWVALPTIWAMLHENPRTKQEDCFFQQLTFKQAKSWRYRALADTQLQITLLLPVLPCLCCIFLYQREGYPNHL